MTKEFKFLIGGTVITLALIFGAAFLLSSGQKEENSGDVLVASQDVSGIEVTPNNVELGEVPINGGIVTKEYEIKNNTEEVVKLGKFATSCMCTTASVSVGEKSTKFFGMEGHGDKNPPVNIEIGSGQTAKVIVKFDPAAHGPQGVGPFDRSIFLYFVNPSGQKEIKFSGVVK